MKKSPLRLSGVKKDKMVSKDRFKFKLNHYLGKTVFDTEERQKGREEERSAVL